MTDKKNSKNIVSNFIDRLGIGLLSALSFLVFYLVLYGTMFLSIGSGDGGIIIFMMKLFLWGPLLAFIIGFVFLINPIELILNEKDN